MRALILILGGIASLRAASTVPAPVASPATIPVNAATQVAVTVQLTDPNLIAGGVNLLQVTSAGASPTVLGIMHDDGQNGDSQTGDGILTLQVSLKQTTPGSIYLQASAAFKGQLQRVLSPILAVPVLAPPTISDFNPKSAPAGSLIIITGSNFASVPALKPTVLLEQQGGTGTVMAPLISVNAGSLAFVVPTNAATGPVTVSVGGQSAVTATPLNVTAGVVFSLTARPANIALIQGQSVVIAVQLSGSNGFSALVSLSIAGLPTGINASFQPPMIAPGQTSALTLTAPNSQPLGSESPSITATASANAVSLSQSANISLTVEAPTTSLIGRTVVSDALETPLAGVTITLLGNDGNGNTTSCSGRTVSDAAGNFALTNLPAVCVGPQLVGYSGATVTAPPGTYAGVNLVYALVPGQVKAAPVLIHLPRIDNQETFNVQQNAATDQSYMFRTIPGLSVTAYAHTTFTMPDGTQPNPFPLTAVNVPVDRLPDVKPPVPTMITAFIVAFQPANATANQPVAVYYPNPLNTPPGMDMALLTLDPTHGAMVPYGTGAVSADGTQIVPDLDPAHPGHRYGLVHFDWHMPGYPVGNQLNPCAFCPVARQGEPVDLSSGLFVINETDISFSGSRGTIAIRRNYRDGITPAATIFGPFGYGTNHNFGYELGVLVASDVSAIPLIMPDGNQFLFSKQSDGTFVNGSSIPMLAGAVMTLDPSNAVNLRWKDGTTFRFIQIRVGSTFRNPLDSITDANGNKIQIVHNGFQISDILDPLGRGLHFNYNVGGNITQITAPDGSFVSYDYDGNNANYLRVVTHPDGTTTRYDYNSNSTGGNITAVTDGRGNVVASNTYDPNLSGRVTQQTQADGSVLQFSYMLQNPTAPLTSPVLATTVTDALGRATVYRFSPAGALLGVTDPLGQTQVFNRDGNNNVTAITGAASCPLCGGSTAGDQAFSYDGNGNVLSETDALGNTTRFTYEPVFNKVTSVQDALGNTTTFAYDVKGNLQTQTDPNGNVTFYQHDAFGELTAMTDAKHQTTSLSYDAFGNLVLVKDALGNGTSFQYDILGRLTLSQDALGRRTQIAYDNANRIIRQTNAQSKTTSFHYDQVGNLLSVIDPRLSATSFTYDAMNRLVTRTDPNNRKDTRTYDQNGNLVRFQDRRGQTSFFTYDTADRLTGETYQDGSSVTRSYDVNNRLAAVIDSAAGAFSFAYDAAGRLTSSTTPNGVVQYMRDGLGRAAVRQVVGQPAVTYAYDSAGNLTAATMPQASATFTYDARNQLSNINRLNGVSTAFTYDPAARLLAIAHAKGPAMIDTESYQYDVVGNRTSHVTNVGQSLVTPAVSSASYDADNEQSQFGTTVNTFEANGSVTSSGNASATTSYTWDSRGRLKSVTTSSGQTTNFTYDFTGSLIAQADSGSSLNLTKTFVLDDLTNVAFESSSDDTSYSVLSGQGIDSHLAIMQSSGQIQYGLSDAINSTVATVDQSGAVESRFQYEPFGQTTTTGTYPFQFTGRVPVSSSLYYYRARFYNSQTGRFISEDPIGFAGGTNLYAYASNGPIGHRDSLGLESTSTSDFQIKSSIATITTPGLPVTLSLWKTSKSETYFDAGLFSYDKTGSGTGSDPYEETVMVGVGRFVQVGSATSGPSAGSIFGGPVVGVGASIPVVCGIGVTTKPTEYLRGNFNLDFSANWFYNNWHLSLKTSN